MRHRCLISLLTAALLALSVCELGFESSGFAADDTEAPGAASDAFPENDYFGKTVGQIQVNGLKRIGKDAVLAKLSAKVGDILTREGLRSDIQSLFSIGYFDDISVKGELADGKVNLTYDVRERPVIAKITFEGNERLTASDFKDVTKIKEWSILDVNKVKEDVGLIQKHYEEKGFYLAKVAYEIKPADKPDQVELIFKINDYDKVQIKKITFLNNKRFSDEQLKGVLGETKEGSALSFLNSSGNFKESAFKQDLQRLTYWYLEHGYVKFKYENPVVTVSDDKKWLYISLYVDEGDQFRIGTVDFGGDLLFGKDELNETIGLTSGEVFSISKRNQDIQHLTEKYQDLGYAFVNVVPKMAFHDDTKTLDMEYDFEKGNLVHFGEINVLGNAKTYDKVIRRELKIHEGDLYNGTNLRLSKENVERLGYFAQGEVIFNSSTPKGHPDILNVEITVKERSTGTITLGAGYGSNQGFFFTTQISEINLLGRGQTLSLAAQFTIGGVNTDQRSQSFNLGFTEPYTFDTLWTSGFDLYHVTFPIPNKYTTKKQGFDVRMGHPIMDYTYGYITYKLERLEDLYPAPGVDQSIIDADTGVLSSVTMSVVRDKRNNRFETTAGNYQSISLETAGLGGDMAYFKFVANNRYYRRVIGDLVFRNSTEFGNISGSRVPPSQKFYLGGPNNMKGFQLFSLGPQKTSTDANGNLIAIPLGGNIETYSLFELEYPLLKEAGIKGVLFFDVGNTTNFNGNLFPLRADAGFGFRWFSPIGPLRFEWGYPLNRTSTEQASTFSFFIGPPF
ncbi:MAG: outer membrane protein assembly factor BamA [Bdellovibrionia bacterium]